MSSFHKAPIYTSFAGAMHAAQKVLTFFTFEKF